MSGKVLRHPSATPRPLVGPQEVADYLGVSKRTVQDLANRRQIPHKTIGRLLRFDLDEVVQWALNECDRPVRGGSR